MKNGKFITLEGTEGVGKSTVTAFLKCCLAEHNIPCVVTREPGGSTVAEKIREVLLAHHEETVFPEAELLLFFAGRKQNIEMIIKPALARGEWVICDRFTDASFAYQGGGRGIEKNRIQFLADWIQADTLPDMTLLLDAPVEVGLERMKDRGDKDRIETEETDFFRRVRDVYLERAGTETDRFRVIAADQQPEAIEEAVRKAVSPLIQEFIACQP